MRFMKLAIHIAVVLVLLSGCGGSSSDNQAAPANSVPESSAPPAQTRETCKVLEVVDGATLAVERNGQRAVVRLIHVDPEGYSSAAGASAGSELRFRCATSGNQVMLEADPALPDADADGRLLRYVFIAKRKDMRPGEDLLNLILIKDARAPLLSAAGVKTRYGEVLYAAARDALSLLALRFTETAQLAMDEITRAQGDGVETSEYKEMSEGLQLMAEGLNELLPEFEQLTPGSATALRKKLSLPRMVHQLTNAAGSLRQRAESEESEAKAEHLLRMADRTNELAFHYMDIHRALGGLADRDSE